MRSRRAGQRSVRPLNCGVRRHVKVISSLWGERVVIDEIEVHISANGHGRVAIARRTDGLFCIYVHGKWTVEILRQLKCEFGDDYSEKWHTDKTPRELLYQDCEPLQGVYGTLDDARREVRSILDTGEADVP